MTLLDFVTWLGTAGGSSAVVSFILERLPFFQKLASEAKRWVFFGSCFVLSVASYLVLTYVPTEILQAIAPYFALVAAVFGSVFFGQAVHKIDKIDGNVG